MKLIAFVIFDTIFSCTAHIWIEPWWAAIAIGSIICLVLFGFMDGGDGGWLVGDVIDSSSSDSGDSGSA